MPFTYGKGSEGWFADAAGGAGKTSLRVVEPFGRGSSYGWEAARAFDLLFAVLPPRPGCAEAREPLAWG